VAYSHKIYYVNSRVSARSPSPAVWQPPTSNKVWFITGAGRGMGVDFAKAALAAGHAVVATGRDKGRVFEALGSANNLLVGELDITSRGDAEAAVQAAVDRFGRIDVLVNNAATRSSTTTTSAEQSNWSFGNPSTASRLATPPSSLAHW
jgi:NAD(P)-dependent dehydrogenase (short-subunit alcohol dehydrogenase family)